MDATEHVSRRLSRSSTTVFCRLEKCLSNQKHFTTKVLKKMIFILQEIEVTFPKVYLPVALL